MSSPQDLSYYLSLPYTMELVRQDESTWFARVLELPGCMTEGDSPEEAAAMIQDAMASWIEIALEDNQPVPKPRPAEEYSGKFVVRVPKSLHRNLVEAAACEEVSLNQYIGTELARAVGRSTVQPVVTRSQVSVTDDPYWPGLQVALRQVMADAGYGSAAQEVDERLCADWFHNQLAEIERDLHDSTSKDAARKIDDLSARLFLIQSRSPMVAVLRSMLGMLHRQAEMAAQLHKAVIKQATETRVTAYAVERITATAEQTIREDSDEYTRWREQKPILGSERTSW